MRVTIVLLLALSTIASVRAQVRAVTSAPVWTGSVRCEIDIKGPGYLNHQTHTWTLSGQTPADGNTLDYPGTWTVTGEGSLTPTGTQPTTAQWKTNGSATGVRMAIFVRASDQKLVVFLRNAQLSVANGTTGTQQAGATRSQPIALTAYEWRPFPMIEDVPTSTHIAGSGATPITGRLDYLMPLGSEGRGTCTWDLTKAGAPQLSRVTLAGAAGAAASTAGAGTSGAAGAKSDVTTVSGAGAASAGAGATTTSAAAGGAALGGVSATTGTTAAGAAAGAAGASSSTAAGGAPAPTGSTSTSGAGAAAAGSAGTAGAAGSGVAGAAGTSTSETPIAAGCDADLPTLACQLGALRLGFSVSASANFHIASDTQDWFAVDVYAGTAAYTILDLRLTGGTADGVYAIDVSEGALASPISLGASGNVHAPTVTVSWASASAASKSIRIKVSHAGGAPSNALYTLSMSVSESATAPLRVVPVPVQIISAAPTSGATGQTGTVAPPSSTSSGTAIATTGVVPLVQTLGTPRLPLSVAPASTAQNRPAVTVTLTGQNTHFVQGTTNANFHFSSTSGSVPVTVTSATTATAQITVPQGTPSGLYTVTLATGTEIAEAANAFMVTPPPDSLPKTCTTAGNMVTNLSPGQTNVVNGVIDTAAVEEWLTIRLVNGSSVHVTLSNGASGTGGSDFQIQAYSACGTAIGTASSGAGPKTLDLLDSGPHQVIVRITANPWAVARPIYTLRLEAR